MVSTHQQYLCPDFLNPSPPTTVDSSPLALLAQTCNSIGLPDPPTSTAGNGSSSSSKSTKSESGKLSESSKGHAKDEATSKASSSSKKATTSIADSSSDSSSAQRSSPTSKERSGNNSPESGQKADAKSRQANVSPTENGRSSGHSSSDTKITTSTTTPAATSSTSTSVMSSSLLQNKCVAGTNPLAAFPVAGFPPALFPPYFPTNSTPVTSFPYTATGHVPTLGLAGACYPQFPSSLPTPSNPWLSSGLPGFAAKCMDPFCKTCPAITAAGVRGGCGTLGCPCVQCGGHSAGEFPFWLPSYSSLLGQTVALHGTGVTLGSSPASMYAAAAAVAAAAAHQQTNSSSTGSGAVGGANQSQQQQQQHTCSWMTGNEFCGKRFSSSEELLQHLRSHTSQDSAAAAAVAAANSSVSLSTPAVTNGVSAAVGHLSSTGRLSPRSTYLNSINSIRYHPYSKLTPSNATASAAAALASIPFPSTALNPSVTAAFNPLSALCSTLSAQRLPASLPHQ